MCLKLGQKNSCMFYFYFYQGVCVSNLDKNRNNKKYKFSYMF